MAGYGYRAGLPSSVVARLVPREPSAGAAVAAGVGQLAQAVGEGAERIDDAQRELAERERRQRATADVAAGNGEWAQEQLKLDADLEKLRNEVPPGAEGFEAKASEIRQKRAAEFLARRSNEPEVRQYFEPLIERDTVQGTLRDRDYEQRKRTEYSGSQFDTWASATSVRVRSGEITLEQAMGDGAKSLSAMPLDTTAKAGMAEKLAKLFIQARADGLIERREFDAATGLTKMPEAAAALGGSDGVGRYTAQIEAGRDIVAREQQAAATEQRRLALEGLEVLKARVGSDNPPTVSEVNAAVARGQAAGVDPSTLVDYGKMGVESARASGAKRIATPELVVQRAALQEKIDAGTASEAERNVATAYDAELKLRDDKEGQNLSAMMKVDPQGAANRVRAMGAERAAKAAAAAGTPKLAVYGFIASSVARSRAVEGAALRAARQDDFLPPPPLGKDSREARTAEARQKFDVLIGRKLRRQLGGQYDDVLGVALDLHAAQRNAVGASNWSESSFRDAVDAVFGGSIRDNGQRQGGIGTIRNRRVALPEKWSANELDVAVSRQSFDRAIYKNGRPAAKSDILTNYTMVDAGIDDGAGGTFYRFETDAGEVLMRDDRKPWLLRLGPNPR